MLLAGDVGATKTNLGIFSSERGPREPLAEATFSSGEYESLVELAGEFLTQANLKVDHAVFGVAGPVVGGQATITNLSWVIDEAELKEKLKLKSVLLLNDLEAVAHGVPLLESEDLHVLNKGEPTSHGAKAVIAPGTGLGEAFLTWDGSRYRAYASEGGHTDFAPSNPLEGNLLDYLRDQWGHVSYERICSGMGIPNIYAFFRDSGHTDEPAWLAEQLAAADDPTAYIVTAALENKAQLCVDTLNLFCSVLGAEAGNMALVVLATGGVYLGGGIPPRIISALEKGSFLEAFCNKGRLSKLMTRIPVYVILNPKIALIGAAFYGLNYTSIDR
ncbi:MAG: glucokinase [Deltaproteobacteria bacterium]|nr:glucokinase [Deltaproteobacteria bacterium]